MPALKCSLALALMCVATAQATEIDSGGTPVDLNRLAVAGRDVYHGRYTQAIAKVSEVIASEPNFAAAYFVRASYYGDAGRYDEAFSDVAKVESFHPDAAQTAELRATLALRQHDAQMALKQLARAAQMQPYSFWKQSFEGSDNSPGTGFSHLVTQHTVSFELAYASIAYEMLGHDTEALDTLSRAIKRETVTPYFVLNTHCWYAAIVGFAEMAELTCGEAIKAETQDIGSYDSMGLAHLKMKVWAKAIDDYNHALHTKPDLTTSLYGRGIAKRASGDTAGGNADIAAAKRDEPDIAGIMARMGIAAS